MLQQSTSKDNTLRTYLHSNTQICAKYKNSTYVLEELSPRDILHDHEDGGGCGDDLIHLDDVRMSEQLEDLYFTPAQDRSGRRKETGKKREEEKREGDGEIS